MGSFFIGLAGCLFVLVSWPAGADVTFDGTLRAPNGLTLGGPDVSVRADQGLQRGSNLFHSFSRFNVNPNQIVTFTPEGATGPIDNVLSRVTGPEVSRIDGTLASTIPNADFYLLNPNGLIFGPQGKLDVRGSFHASTANYIRLEDSTVFSAQPAGNEVLTSAAPSAFGFLDAPAEIRVETASVGAAPYPELRVNPGKSLSFTGGDLTFQDPNVRADEGEGGAIRLVSLSRGGEIPVSAWEKAPVSPAEGGTIRLNNTSLLAGNRPFSRGNTPGSIIVQGKNIHLTGSAITTSTYSNTPGGEIYLSAEKITLDRNAEFVAKIQNTTDLSSGQGGNTTIEADELTLRGGAVISTGAGLLVPSATGNAGILELRVGDLKVSEGSQITSATEGRGNGGDIFIRAERGVTLHGVGMEQGQPSGIFLSAEKNAAGSGGNLTLNSAQLRIENGAQVGSVTFGAGDAGNLDLETGQTQLQGTDTVLSVAAKEGSTGDAGAIRLKAGGLRLLDGAQILAESETATQGGDITILMADQAGDITLAGHSRIAASNTGSGEAGTLTIDGARNIQLEDGSTLSVATAEGQAGDIRLNASRLVYLLDSAITTSAAAGEGNGGNIHIDPVFVVLNNSQIIANALRGAGGNIRIVTDHFLASNNSTVSASSEFGLQGTVSISAPVSNLAQSIAVLPSNLLDTNNLLRDECATRHEGSSFVVESGGRVQPSPDDELTQVPATGGCGF